MFEGLIDRLGERFGVAVSGRNGSLAEAPVHGVREPRRHGARHARDGGPDGQMLRDDVGGRFALEWQGAP